MTRTLREGPTRPRRLERFGMIYFPLPSTWKHALSIKRSGQGGKVPNNTCRDIDVCQCSPRVRGAINLRAPAIQGPHHLNLSTAPGTCLWPMAFRILDECVAVAGCLAPLTSHKLFPSSLPRNSRPTPPSTHLPSTPKVRGESPGVDSANMSPSIYDTSSCSPTPRFVRPALGEREGPHG